MTTFIETKSGNKALLRVQNNVIYFVEHLTARFNWIRTVGDDPELSVWYIKQWSVKRSWSQGQASMSLILIVLDVHTESIN